MNKNKKLLLGIGSAIAPISMIAAVSCGIVETVRPVGKTSADAEVDKVTLTFPNASTTLATAITTTSNFTSSGFNKEAYDLKIISIMVGSDSKSVSVTVRLDSKNETPKIESKLRVITITGFKAKEITDAGDGNTGGGTGGGTDTGGGNTGGGTGGTDTGGGNTGGGTGGSDTGGGNTGGSTGDDKEKEKPKSVDPKITEQINNLTEFINERVKKLKFSDVLVFDQSVLLQLVSELEKTEPKISFNVSTLELYVSDKLAVRFKVPFFDSVKGGLEYLITSNGGNFQKLIDVVQSKKDSIEALLSDPATTKFITFIKQFATFENDWQTTLKTALKLSNIAVRLNFDENSISVKTAEKEFKKILTFNADFIEGIKDVFKKAALELVKNLEISKSTTGKDATDENSKNTFKTTVNFAIEFLFKTVLKGTFEISKSEKGEFKFAKVKTTPKTSETEKVTA